MVLNQRFFVSGRILAILVVGFFTFHPARAAGQPRIPTPPRIYQMDFYGGSSPVITDTEWGDLEVDLSPTVDPNGYYLQLLVRLPFTSDSFWVIRNMPVPAGASLNAPVTLRRFFSLKELGVTRGTPIESIDAAVIFTLLSTDEPPTASYYDTYAVLGDVYDTNIGVSEGGSESYADPGLPPSYDLATTPSMLAPPVALRTDVPDVEEAPNECGLAAVTRSLMWLKNRGDIEFTSTTQEIMDAMRSASDWSTTGGIPTYADTIRGKLALTAGLHVSNKFQVRRPSSVPSGDFVTSDGTAVDRGTSLSYEFIRQEIMDDEDVEIVVGWMDGETRTGGHAMTVVGVTETSTGVRQIVVQDDAHQGTTDTQDRQRTTRYQDGSPPRLLDLPSNRVEMIISESPTPPGPFTQIETEPFSTDVTNPVPGDTTGWTPFSGYQVGQSTDYDSAAGALRVTVSSGSVPRINGWMTGNSEWIPYGTIGSGNYVRGKFYVFTSGGAQRLNVTNGIPNLRIRLSTRFAVNSMLEVFNHLAGDPAGTIAGNELAPSADPGLPSLYRLDFDPIDVPALETEGEGVLRGFEAYSLEPQEAGSLELTESSVGVYPVLLDSGPYILAHKVYTCSASDAGDLKVFNSVVDGPFFRKFTLVSPGNVGAEIALDGITDPTYRESAAGVTLDSTPVTSITLGLATREFTELGTDSERARVEQDVQYRLRWHVTSSTNANSNPQLRLRARAIKFMWSQKLEIGGANAAGDLNNAIARQALPGVGTMNPDQQIPGENGGWYTLLLHSPISPDIRPLQPYITAQPGPGDPASSIRDIKFGFDILDTLSGRSQSRQEAGEFTVDRVELTAYPLIPD